MKIAGLVLVLLFYIFFLVRNFYLQMQIKEKVKSKSLIVNLTILFTFVAIGGTFLQVVFPRLHPYLAVLVQNIIYLDIAGLFFIAAGVLLGIISSISLSKSWRVGIPQDEKTELVTGGIYRLSRNPYFTSMIAIFIGQILLTTNIAVLTGAIFTIVLIHIMVLKEERYLEKTHGEDYRAYKKRTARYIFF